ncbi:hypothetical protein B0A49_03199 [Cryomyces minteri]|uniref:Sld7 C-terminal domain-containing protein n=1 Tax=Cryomyces minteri TaxID=331657 RepID=A0A4U0XFN0_9PEZI|nr:hypothetical protein B0A49_03199 [Cryomyces minteri]
MDVWSGDISLPDGQTIRDLHICSTTSTSAVKIPPTSAFRFLSHVDVAHVPLYLAAGPSLHVWTDAWETQEWFTDNLLYGIGEFGLDDELDKQEYDASQWWQAGSTQSSVGVLVEVVSDESPSSARPRITEILFYGAATLRPRDGPFQDATSERMQTSELNLQCRVHAMPLSSDLLYRAPVDHTTPPLSPTNASERSEEARFLPPSLDTFFEASKVTAKRQRVDDVFDEAAAQRKRARRTGVQGVAATAARFGGPLPGPQSHRRSLSGRTATIAEEAVSVSGAEGIRSSREASATAIPLQTRALSRSPSLSSSSRPTSMKGALNAFDVPGKRSSLYRVESISAMPSTLTEEEASLETKNKDVLSRLVMAGMRLYGLSQSKRKSRRGSTAPSAQDAISERREVEEKARDDEYKLIYHQTFKGAVFAFRQYMATEALQLHTERLRDTVDKLLMLYCQDPLTTPVMAGASEDTLTPGGRKAFGADGGGGLNSARSAFLFVYHVATLGHSKWR